jgi:WD40 repeat protein
MNCRSHQRAFLTALLLWQGAASAPLSGAPLSFATDIQPLLEQSCLPCHNATKAEGGLILESPKDMLEGGDAGVALKPNKARESLLFLTAAHLKKPFMPPEANKAKAPALTQPELEVLERWIQEGARGLAKQKEPVAWQEMPARVTGVGAIALSPEGQFAAVARGNRVSIYDLLIGNKVASFTPHPDLVGALAFSPDGSLLATGSRGEAKLWKRVFDPKVQLPEPLAGGTATSADGAYTTALEQDDSLWLREAKGGKKLAKLSADHALVAAKAALELELAGAKFEVSFLEGELKALGEKVTKLTTDLAAAEKARTELQPKRDGLEKTLSETLQQKERLMLERDALEENFTAATRALAQAEEARTAAASSLSGAAVLLQKAGADTKAEAGAEVAGARAVSEKAAEQHKTADTAAKDAKEKREAKQKEYTEAIKAHGVAAGAVSSATTLERNAKNYAEVLAQSTAERTAQQAVAERAKAALQAVEAAVAVASEKVLNARLPAVETVAFSPDGAVVFTAYAGGVVRAWSGSSGRPLLSPDTQPRWELARTIGDSTKVETPLANRVNALAFSPDGHWLATAAGEPSRSGQIKIWATDSGALVREFMKPHKDTVLALDFSGDGKWLASGSSDRAVRVWETQTGKMHRNLEAHSSQVLAVSLRSDGRRVASASADNSVKTWDIQRSDVVATFASFAKEVSFLRYLGRGDELVAASGAPAVKILKDAGGETRAKTEGFKRFITAGAASKDGASQLVGDAEGVVRLLDREGNIRVEWAR